MNKDLKQEITKKHKHKYTSSFSSLAYAMSGKGNIAVCDICHKEFDKYTGKLVKNVWD